MKNLNKETRYAMEIYAVVSSLFDEESENYQYKISEIDATAFFTGFVIAFSMLYKRLSDHESDLMEATYLANRLVFQYLLKNGEGSES